MNELIEQRRSVRSYLPKEIAWTDIEAILSAGMHAPSGKNGQPWRFITVQKDKALLRELAGLTVYDGFVRTADALIVVLLDKTQSYHYVKDCQAVGACIQNMLLRAVSQGIGACWIGEILNRDTAVKQLLGLSHRYDLMAVVTLGFPNDNSSRPPKKSLSDCLMKKL